jgi:hypothetical protein
MLLYGIAIFLSACLLFQVQLIIGKIILPWFGGGASVWTTCLLFFQSGLLVGYVYAHGSIRYLKPRAQVVLHLSLLGASLFLLPLAPGSAWKPAGPETPVLRIVALLASTAGLPYILLSTTSPLLQAWFSRTHRGHVPYRLFAVSNAGSLAGLLSYPLLVEPVFSLRLQSWGWSGAFVLFTLLCAAAGVSSLRRADYRAAEGEEEGETPAAGTMILWFVLSLCPAGLLLAVTNHLTQNIAPIPFLWVLPLTLYLLSFILVFYQRGQLYWRKVYLALLVPGLAATAYLLPRETVELDLLISVMAGGFFVCSMVCHGELARLKPHPRHLTLFYLILSAGGAAGGLFVGLAAPFVFGGYFEYHLFLALTAFLAAGILLREFLRNAERSAAAAAPAVTAVALAFALSVTLALQVREVLGTSQVLVRNFYGILHIRDWDVRNSWIALRELIHGVTPHGTQFLSPARRRQPTTYYGPLSGGGLALQVHRRPEALKAGVIGLGAGTLAVYGQPGDLIRFYEINPLVRRRRWRLWPAMPASPWRKKLSRNMIFSSSMRSPRARSRCTC